MVKRLLLVNSKDRTALSNSSSDFQIAFNRSFNNVRSIKLLSYEIANTIYNVNNYNNSVRLVENGSTINLTLTNGSYTASELATHLQTIMNSATLNGVTYTVSYNSTLFKYVIVADMFTFKFDFTTNNNAYLLLGYPKEISAEASTLTSPNAIRLDISCALLEMDISNNIDTSTPALNCSWLLELPSSGGVHSKYIKTTYENNLPVSASTIRDMSLRIKNSDNQTLDFNGSNTIFLFELTLD